ncbi:hypothetical protein [Streptomyces lincolnensis]|uniref:hypothetical protein n=1 Tax=Streptomyces lincolnensis TaxID=1915 RepID=UPI00082A9F57|nr:hypothetical protein [Streptomyces lincolnensis]QMV05006.1 hypothetical protein GJU35_04630 [Streptomyces lincolnensis]
MVFSRRGSGRRPARQAHHMLPGREPVLIRRSDNRSRQAVIPLSDVRGGIRDRAARGLPVEDARGAAGTVV